MATLRFYAIKESLNRKPINVEETDRRSSIFGLNVFNDRAGVNKRFLPKRKGCY